ncbi:hypothetical protein HAX54_017684 [Datura stramonium]|uniref:Uncharacterized protein n=1 Tax=Datura stramonium TaxID=4076 RepID=A0ABS8UMD5_DATST|nr:hypothetical protein [Datura stramonium]
MTSERKLVPQKSVEEGDYEKKQIHGLVVSDFTENRVRRRPVEEEEKRGYGGAAGSIGVRDGTGGAVRWLVKRKRRGEGVQPSESGLLVLMVGGGEVGLEFVGRFRWPVGNGRRQREKKREKVVFDGGERDAPVDSGEGKMVVAGKWCVAVRERKDGGVVFRCSGAASRRGKERRKWWWPETKERERGERRRLCLGRGRKWGKTS